LIEALKVQKTGTMATDQDHFALEVEGYLETVKFTSHNSAILRLWEDPILDEMQSTKNLVVLNNNQVLGSNIQDYSDAGAESSEHALDAVRNREAELEDVELPDAYQSDESEDKK
jgi:hypothetical protein